MSRLEIIETDAAAIRRALLEDTLDLRNAEASAPEFVPGTGELLRERTAHIMFAAEGAGKSTLAHVLVASAAIHGERVLYLDRENDPGLTRARHDGILAATGWADPLATGHLLYRNWPELEVWPPDAYAEAIAGAGLTGVVYDSVREMLAQLGLDRDREFSTFINHMVTPLIKGGLWVLMLDNVGHLERDRPLGDSAKLHGIPLQYKVTAREPFSATQRGVLDLECTRTRFDAPGRTWSMRVGGGHFEVPSPRVARDEDLDLVLRVLAQSPGLGVKGVQEACRGRDEKRIREALKRGVESGRIHLEKDGTRHRHFNVVTTVHHASEGLSENHPGPSTTLPTPGDGEVQRDGSGCVVQGGEPPVGGSLPTTPRDDEHRRAGRDARAAS